MGKKRGGTRRSSAAELLETPPLTPPPATDSPKSAIFNRKRNSIGCKFSSPENTNIAKNKVPAGLFKSSPRNASSLSSISDLKDFASSQLLDLKRHIDHYHSQIVKDLDSSNSRLQKRFKIQSQTCQKMMDEAEKEYKKMAQRIHESQEAMKASYEEFLAHEEESASRACKTFITELSQSFERSIDALRSRFGITST
ncbi:hypothetical protein IC575_009197 [Cucumis melo]|uniref:Uncharacterized protein LOC103499240 n=1 Tax=Cucumis melo TaxID=3656 RepID=A0A1S3CCJ9_CUCME|nr:uncharacterized protein LOC103499240 [Cucumis melo]XP_050939709.1 uncharacterized protein LOC103499240 [Cucumis melo]